MKLTGGATPVGEVALTDGTAATGGDVFAGGVPNRVTEDSVSSWRTRREAPIVAIRLPGSQLTGTPNDSATKRRGTMVWPDRTCAGTSIVRNWPVTTAWGDPRGRWRGGVPRGAAAAGG